LSHQIIRSDSYHTVERRSSRGMWKYIFQVLVEKHWYMEEVKYLQQEKKNNDFNVFDIKWYVFYPKMWLIFIENF
jgi:hypothetical protein